MPSDTKMELAKSVLWDAYLGNDLLAGGSGQTFDMNILSEKDPSLDHNKEQIKIPEKQELVQTKKDEGSIKKDILLSGVNTLNDLYEEIKKFNGCANLRANATNVVLFDGVQNAEIMLIGEAPGEEEDLKGIPFCGPSGQLLDKALETIDVSRKTNLYITNSVFWRPHANRKPTDEEIEECRPFVEKTIEIIKPKIIVLCGATACASVLKTKESMNNLRRKIINYKTANGYSTKCAAIYHPAFLLRNPIAKKAMWFDLLFIKQNI